MLAETVAFGESSSAQDVISLRDDLAELTPGPKCYASFGQPRGIKLCDAEHANAAGSESDLNDVAAAEPPLSSVVSRRQGRGGMLARTSALGSSGAASRNE